jgi:hypothetical protein
MLERIAKLSSRDLKTGCRLWVGAVTASGAPRLVVDGCQVDARRVMYELTHECELPPYVRMTTTCGNVLCVTADHVKPAA